MRRKTLRSIYRMTCLGWVIPSLLHPSLRPSWTSGSLCTPLFQTLRKPNVCQLSTLDIAPGCAYDSCWFQGVMKVNMTRRYTPIPENEYYSTVHARIYDQGVGLDQDPIDSHRLAVLYMVFALGTLFDLEKPYLSIESTQYYQLARASLSIDSVLEHQTIPAIQALVSVFPYLCGPRLLLRRPRSLADHT